MKTENKYTRFAFTMAELLLSLTILAVIAALMLRSVNRINPDQDKQLFLRTFHAIEAAAGEVVNDTSLYDSDMSTISDFSTDPLPTARVDLYAQGVTKSACSSKSRAPVSDCDKVITKTNAVCYFIASKMNLNGIANCSSGSDVLNFKMGNGVCVYGLAGSAAPFEFAIDTECKGVEHGYAAKIYPSGSMTVPQTSSKYGGVFEDPDAQKKAYSWLYLQTDVKKRDYNFEEGGSSGD